MPREKGIALHVYIRKKVLNPNLMFYFQKQTKISVNPKHTGEKK